MLFPVNLHILPTTKPAIIETRAYKLVLGRSEGNVKYLVTSAQSAYLQQ